jgi:hypothetical protein
MLAYGHAAEIDASMCESLLMFYSPCGARQPAGNGLLRLGAMAHSKSVENSFTNFLEEDGVTPSVRRSG